MHARVSRLSRGGSRLCRSVILCSCSRWETHFFFKGYQELFSSIAVELNLPHLGDQTLLSLPLLCRTLSPVEKGSQIKCWNLISSTRKYSLTVILSCSPVITCSYSTSILMPMWKYHIFPQLLSSSWLIGDSLIGVWTNFDLCAALKAPPRAENKLLSCHDLHRDCGLISLACLL